MLDANNQTNYLCKNIKQKILIWKCKIGDNFLLGAYGNFGTKKKWGKNERT